MSKFLDTTGLGTLRDWILQKLGLKQDTLVSGTNIKTVNNQSLLGSGNISISGGSGLQNLVDGSATGSIRGVDTAVEGSSYTMGTNAFAEGYNTKASGDHSHVEGYNCGAQGMYAHAEGFHSFAIGEASHAEGGYNTFAEGYCSHAEGEYSFASGYASHAEGMSSATGDYSHAQNGGTIAAKESQTALGNFNIEDTATTTTHSSGKVDFGQYAVIVGNGIDVNNRSNAFTIDWRGNTEASGDITDGSGNVLSDKADSTDLVNYLPLTGGTLTGELTETDVINSKNNNYERDIGGTLNEGFRIVDKNGDVVAYMKGISTLDNQDRTIEGFNVGTSRDVNGSTKWNTLRLMIDADGKPIIIINQSAAWREALEVGGLLERTTHTIDSSLTIANGSFANSTKTITKSGYRPLAIAGWRLSNGSGSGSSYGLVSTMRISDASDGSVTIAYIIRSVGNVDNCTLSVDVLWQKI